MAASAHQDPAFTNAVTYTVAITYTVAGGTRFGTADRRARKVAERLASQAARTAGVVEVSAVAGVSHDGDLGSSQRVRFDAANSGQGTYGEPGKLDRYLDPDRERALASLAAADAAAERLRRADRVRREQVGCRNAHPQPLAPPAWCECLYCQPDLHQEVAQLAAAGGPAAGNRLCVCGAPVATPGGRCPDHRQIRVVVLDGDPTALRWLGHSRDRGLDR